jgi:hypothetical protein
VPFPSPQLARKREDIVREHVAAENAHDVGRVLATFHSPRYEVMPTGSCWTGRRRWLISGPCWLTSLISRREHPPFLMQRMGS